MKQVCLALVCVLAGIGIGFICFSGPKMSESLLVTNGLPDKTTQATLEFDNTDEATCVVRITSQKLIDECITDPVRKSQPDPNPAPYRVLGQLYWYEHGTRKSALLFTPWGNLRIDGKYLIADLSELKKLARHYLHLTSEMADRQ